MINRKSNWETRILKRERVMDGIKRGKKRDERR